jgi:hypothetical protein
VATYQLEFDYIHVNAALTTAVRLGAADGSLLLPASRISPLEKQVLAQVTKLARRHLGQYNPQAIANTLWALAKLGVYEPDVLSKLVELAQARFPEFTGQQFAACIWALAKLGSKPPALWIEAFLARSQQLLPSFSPQDLSNTIYAFALLEYRPPEAWLLAFMAAVQQAAAGPSSRAGAGYLEAPGSSSGMSVDASSSSSSSSSSSRGSSGSRGRSVDASSSSRGRSVDASSSGSSSSSRMKPQDLSNTLWALAVLNIRPDDTWLAWFQQQLLHQMPACNQQVLANTIWALARLGATPSQPFLEGFLQQCSSQLAEASGSGSSSSPQGYSNTLASLAKLQQRPGEAWLRAYVAAIQPQLRRFKPQELANTLWALAKLGHQPPQEWQQVRSGGRLLLCGRCSGRWRRLARPARGQGVGGACTCTHRRPCGPLRAVTGSRHPPRRRSCGR